MNITIPYENKNRPERCPIFPKEVHQYFKDEGTLDMFLSLGAHYFHFFLHQYFKRENYRLTFTNGMIYFLKDGNVFCECTETNDFWWEVAARKPIPGQDTRQVQNEFFRIGLDTYLREWGWTITEAMLAIGGRLVGKGFRRNDDVLILKSRMI